MFVYKITNNVTGLAYIGITTLTIKKRWKDHKSSARTGGNSYLWRSIRKYGEENFSIEMLYEGVDKRELVAVEKALIASYRTMSPFGYNLTCGGDGLSGRIMTDDLRSKFRDAAKKRMENGTWFTPRKTGEYKHSLETKEKMSAAKKGRPLTQAAMDAAKLASTGDRNIMRRDRSVVERAAATRRGKKRSVEQKLNMSAGLEFRKKLTDHDVAKIKRLFLDGISNKDVLIKYPHVSYTTIFDIRNGRTRKLIEAAK